MTEPDPAATAASAIEITDAALDELAAIGCDPVDQASALLVSGLIRLDSIDDLPAVLATYRLLLEHVLEALGALQTSPAGTLH